MKKYSSLSLAVLGTGWSGSGALIDLLKKQSQVSSYPYELDFWRRPNGLRDLKSQRELFIFFGKEIFATIYTIFKSTFKLLIYPSSLKINLKKISIHSRMFFLMSFFFLFTIFSKDVQSKKKFFIKIFKLLFGGRFSVFVFDQAVFLEQIDDSALGDLGVDACIIVLRDVYDQVQDLLNNSNFLKVNTIRESFFLGAQDDFGSNPNSLQLNLILLTLRERMRKLTELVDKHPGSFLILKFEDIVQDTESIISRVNEFLQSKGFPASFIDFEGSDEILINSKKNIGIGKQTSWTKMPLMKEINSNIDSIVNKFK